MARSADDWLLPILPSAPLTNSNLNRRSVNAGVILIEVTRVDMLHRLNSTATFVANICNICANLVLLTIYS